MNHLVREATEDGDSDHKENPWHLYHAAYERIFCNALQVNLKTTPANYELRSVGRGGITCADCLLAIAEIKAVRL